MIDTRNSGLNITITSSTSNFFLSFYNIVIYMNFFQQRSTFLDILLFFLWIQIINSKNYDKKLNRRCRTWNLCLNLIFV